MDYKSIRIVDAVKDEINCNYFLPDIQREFEWEPYKVEKLFDSIMRDFPIGSFLFWKVKEDNIHRWNVYDFIKDYDAEKPHNSESILTSFKKDIYLILDGQQRLTSLLVGLMGSYRFHYYRWRKTQLYLNVFKKPILDENEPEELLYKFMFRESRESDNPEEYWYPVSTILKYADAEDAKDSFRAKASSCDDDNVDMACRIIGKLHNCIHTRPLVHYYEERDQDYDKVLNIFVRANSTGKPLGYSDLLLSTATAQWEGLNAREEINELVDDINQIGCGFNFGKDFILKAALYLTGDLAIQYSVSNFTKQNLREIEKNWNNIKIYLKTTIRLVYKFGFNSKNIVAPLALLPIAKFLLDKGLKNFDKSSQKDDVKNQERIRRWLIVAILKNAFGSSTDTKLKNIRKEIHASLGSFPVLAINKCLMIEAGFSESEVENFVTYQYNGRYTRLILSLLYPDRVIKDTIFHEDHIFPKSKFYKKELQNNFDSNLEIELAIGRFNRIPNLQLLPDSENISKNAEDFETWIATRDSSFKKIHLIPELKEYSLSNFHTFYEKRKELIVKQLSQFSL